MPELRSYFADLSIPERPPDVSAKLRCPHGDAETIFGRHEAWFSGPDSPVAITLAASKDGRDYGGHEFTDTATVHWAGKLGLQPALQFLGIHTFQRSDKENSRLVNAMLYPPADKFCDRMNTLLAAEQQTENPLPRFKLYGDRDENHSVYSFGLLSRCQVRGIELIARAPVMSRHDIIHALAIYALGRMMPRVMQPIAASIVKANDPDQVTWLGHRHERTASLVDVIEMMGLEDSQGALEDCWQELLRQSASTMSSNEVFKEVADRVTSTPKRLASLTLTAQ